MEREKDSINKRIEEIKNTEERYLISYSGDSKERYRSSKMRYTSRTRR